MRAVRTVQDRLVACISCFHPWLYNAVSIITLALSTNLLVSLSIAKTASPVVGFAAFLLFLVSGTSGIALGQMGAELMAAHQASAHGQRQPWPEYYRNGMGARHKRNSALFLAMVLPLLFGILLLLIMFARTLNVATGT